MNCIKTGCTVLANGKCYHGDLFLDEFGFQLRGVPPGGDGYEPIGFHHCEADDIKFASTLGEYKIFWIHGGLTATKEFYKHLQQWEPAAVQYFKVAP